MTEEQARRKFDLIRERDKSSAICANRIGDQRFLEMVDDGPKKRRHFQGGPVAEMIVAADMILADYEVFRPVDHRASCDLICMKTGTFVRVEVKSAMNATGPKVKVPIDRNRGKFDLLGIVFSDGTIRYMSQAEVDGRPALWIDVPRKQEKESQYGLT